MNVIFVCTGNTCRSPMAEAYLKSFKIIGLNVQSRGLFSDSSPISLNSAAVLLERGIDASDHISRQFTAEDTLNDLIICLSNSHRDALISCGVAPDKIIVLNGGISDPFGGDIHIYRKCRDEIFSAVDSLVFSGTFTPFNIIQAHPSHIPQIAALEAECFSEPWSEQAISESMNAKTRFFVAVEDEKITGYIGISTILDEGYITNVAVTERKRQAGVASLLLNRVFSLAFELDLSFISLEVRKTNFKAISLYSNMGFEAVGERKNFYRNPTENAIIMTRRFDRNYENSCN